MIEMKDLKRHIGKMYKKYQGNKYDFLGLVENQDLSPEVESCFVGGVPGWWNWVNGNEKMKALIAETVGEVGRKR